LAIKLKGTMISWMNSSMQE